MDDFYQGCLYRFLVGAKLGLKFQVQRRMPRQWPGCHQRRLTQNQLRKMGLKRIILTGWLLDAPSPGIEPAALAYWEDALAN